MGKGFRKNNIVQNISVFYAARSDVGRKRRNNEDNLYCCDHIIATDMHGLPYSLSGRTEKNAIFAICDGMGGHQFGELASQMAVQVLSEYAEKILIGSFGSLDEIIHEYTIAVNQKIRNGIYAPLTGTGTTLALVILKDGYVKAYNIGDSRIYTVIGGKLCQISIDHTVGMKNIQKDANFNVQMSRTGSGNMLTACLGIQDKNGNDFCAESLPAIKLQTGRMRLLLCSDGLSDMISEYDIGQILRVSKTVEKAAAALISKALNNGGMDNVTAIVIDVVKSKRTLLKRIFKMMR